MSVTLSKPVTVAGQVMHTIEHIERAHRSVFGGHFFDADARRFFGSRIGANVYGKRYFVTSERTTFGYDAPRGYTIREIRTDGSIETVGEFGQYVTRQAAHRAARKLAR